MRVILFKRRLRNLLLVLRHNTFSFFYNLTLVLINSLILPLNLTAFF